MGILDDLTRMIPDQKEKIEKSSDKFDLDYNEENGTYFVNKDDTKCCIVEFVDNRTDRTVEIDDAQLEPEYHTVYVVRLTEDSKEFQSKLDDMGFDNISVDEDYEPKPGEDEYWDSVAKDVELEEKKLLDFLSKSLTKVGDQVEVRPFTYYYVDKDGTIGMKSEDGYEPTDMILTDRGVVKSDEEIQESNLSETSNMDIVQQFISDSFAHNEEEAEEMGIDQFSTVWGSTNVKISKQDNGWALINYDTPLMFRSDSGDLYFNTDKYSATTTRVQDQIKNALGDTEVKEVDEEEIKNVIH